MIDEGGITMNEKLREKWSLVRKKGKKSFIINRGILGYGIPSMIVYLVLTMMIDISSDSSLKRLLFSLIFIPIGALWGHTIWKINEKRYADTNTRLS